MHPQYLLNVSSLSGLRFFFCCFVSFALFCFVLPKEQFVIHAVEVSFASRLEILEILPSVGTDAVSSLFIWVWKVFEYCLCSHSNYTFVPFLFQ